MKQTMSLRFRDGDRSAGLTIGSHDCPHCQQIRVCRANSHTTNPHHQPKTRNPAEPAQTPSHHRPRNAIEQVVPYKSQIGQGSPSKSSGPTMDPIEVQIPSPALVLIPHHFSFARYFRRVAL